MFFCLDSGTPLPVQFTPQDPGHYPTQIILKSVNDTCVYQVECTVSQGGLGAELEFTTPLHQSVTQDIPLVRIIFTSITTIQGYINNNIWHYHLINIYTELAPKLSATASVV